jgi:hypothetical protein
MIAAFNRFEIQMTMEQAKDCTHSGACDLDVSDLLREKRIQRQLNRIGAEKIATELKEYGAWNDTELSNVEENKARIVWIAAGNIVERQ